jgi:hypothetical protein
VSIWPRCSNPDPCIGYLPGVYNACCGHGNPAEAYLTFGLSEHDAEDHPGLVGPEALFTMRAMRTALGDITDERWHGGHDS